MKFRVGEKVKLLVNLTWYNEGDIVEITDTDTAYPDVQYEIWQKGHRKDYAFEHFLKDCMTPPVIQFGDLYCKCVSPTEKKSSADRQTFYICTDCKKEIKK